MPGILTNARNFRLNTDYEMDKIIYMSTGAFSSDNVGIETNIPHELGFAPLIVAQWSINDNFLETYETTTALFRNSPYEQYVLASADGTDLKLFAFSDIPRTLYYRVYGLLPSGVTPTLPSTNALADTFTFNTNFVASKVVSQGVTPTSSTQQSVTVEHGLGYKPQVLGWEDDAGVVTPINFFSGATEYANIKVGASSITVRTTSDANSTNPRRVHYRIYADA